MDKIPFGRFVVPPVIKISIFTVFLFCFIFGGIVWTKPLTIEQIDNEYIAPAMQNNTDNTTSLLGLLSHELHDTITIKEVKSSKHLEPSMLFLFGTGMIGFGLIAKKRI